jgi:hypothetical protein
LPFAARTILGLAGVLIASGGLYDLFTPRLPPNLIAICGSNKPAQKLVRELLRALGGCLLAIGLTVCLVAATAATAHWWIFAVVLLLVLPAESVNAFCMYRVGSPYYFPLAFALLAVLGVVVGWLQSPHLQ